STNKIKDLDRKRHCSPSRILLWGNIRGNTPTPLIVKPALRGGGLTHTRLKGTVHAATSGGWYGPIELGVWQACCPSASLVVWLHAPLSARPNGAFRNL